VKKRKIIHAKYETSAGLRYAVFRALFRVKYNQCPYTTLKHVKALDQFKIFKMT